MNQPRPTCVACSTAEVSFFALLCDACKHVAISLGLFTHEEAELTEPDTRIQIGPLDV